MCRVNVGVWCDVGGADVVELLATTGVDWLGIDAQHGAFDDREVRLAVAASADLACRLYVRVVANEPWVIGRALTRLGSGHSSVRAADGE